MGTFKARGAGGSEFEFDELVPGTQRGDLLAEQIRRGDLVVLDKKGTALAGAEEIVAFLDAFDAPLGNRVVEGDPVIIGPGPAVSIDGDVDRPQVGEPEIPVADDNHTPDKVGDVPDGTIPEVIDWVRGALEGDDPTDGWGQRARAALDAEVAKGDDARSTLVEKLEDVVAAAEAPADA